MPTAPVPGAVAMAAIVSEVGGSDTSPDAVTLRAPCGRAARPFPLAIILAMSIVYALRSVASPALDQLMLFVTQLGSEYVYVALLVVAFVAVDAKRSRSLALTLLVSLYLNQVLKMTFATLRPFHIDPSVAPADAVATAPGNGFPSGHAQGSVTFWTAASTYVRRRWFAVLATLVVLLVCLSRVYLGLHLPIDVVGGLAFGLATVGAALYLQSRGVRLGRAATIVGGLAGPLALQLVYPLELSGMLLGAFAAFAVGPELVRHDTSGPVAGRAVLAVIALALVFAALFGSSALLPEDVKRNAVWSFVRYFLIGCVGTVLVPWLGRVTGLVPQGREAAPAGATSPTGTAA